MPEAEEGFSCRRGCGACCIAPSINEPFYGMPQGKAANVRCVHLLDNLACALFRDPRRPTVCAAFAAEPAICGDNPEQAMANLQRLEVISMPGATP